jgi:hypothetical protein
LHAFASPNAVKPTFQTHAATIGFLLVTLIGIVTQTSLRAQPNSSQSQEATNKFYSPSGKWTRASNTNCVVWNSFPVDTESVTWSGGVLDGKAHGKGTVQWFTNGTPTTSYVGEMKHGLADGHGRAKSPFEEYEGEWSRGLFVSTNGTIKYPDGNWYKGELQNGFKTGKGEELMKGGMRYVGQFEDGRFKGKGELILTNGDRITGDWRDSKLLGAGTYHVKGGGSFKVKQTEAGIERLGE